MDEEIKTVNGSDEGPGTFEVTFKEKIDKDGVEILANRVIVFNDPSEGQLAVIGKAVHKANRGGGKNTLEAIALILDVIDNLVVDTDDRNWLQDGLVDASLKLADFIGVLDGLNKTGDEPKPKAPLANRARSGRR